MSIEIKEVTTRKELLTFIRFPFQLYRDNPYWAPPLIFDELNALQRDKNPAFEHCDVKYWLALEQGRVVGRIAGIIQRKHIEKWGQRYLRFGWLDFVDNPAVSQALFQTLETWGYENGLTAVHGPLGFTDLDREGMLVEGFEEPGTMITIYNYPYYAEHMQRLGYEKDTDWLEYEILVPPEPVGKIARAAEIVMHRCQFKLLKLQKKQELLAYANELFEVWGEAYKNLYGFVPLSEKQVQQYIKQYFDYVSPDLAPIVLDKNGRMAAFGLAMPSLTRALQKANGKILPFGFAHLLWALKKNQRADLYLVAVRQEYQGSGVNAILIDHLTRVFNRMGIDRAESNPELETNHLVQTQWKYFERRQHKRRRCFIKHLENAKA